MKRFLLLLCVMAVFVNFAGCFSSDESDEKTYDASFTLEAYGQDLSVSFSDYWIFDLPTSSYPKYDGTWYGSGSDSLGIQLPGDCKAGDTYTFPGDAIGFNVEYQGRKGTIAGLTSPNSFKIEITEKNDSFIAGTFSGDINGEYEALGLSGVYKITNGVFKGDYFEE